MNISRISLVACLALLASQPLAAQAESATGSSAPTAWPFEASDIPVDPVYRFGRLDNGMRYIVAHNERPAGTALVRFWIGSGSLEETEEQRGLAHFLEHMAFNGSKRIPEGEMIRLLEREGLAFGADTNASTGIEQTIYQLDLPRTDPALIDTALMLMRETASELTILPDAVDRERGIVISERRDRIGFAWKQFLDQIAFATPGARYVERLPIGELDILERASADDIRAYYRREYVPTNATLIIVGDIDLSKVEQRIRETFANWRAEPIGAAPDAGPIDIGRQGLTSIYTDPALSERVTVFRHKAYAEQPDTTATRRQKLLAGIGYEIVNRRLAALSRGENAPFRSAGYGTSDIFKAGRTTSLIVDTADGEWRGGLLAATATLRQALAYGFTDREVAEQLAKLRTAQQNAAAAAETRSNDQLMEGALTLLDEDQIPSAPNSTLARFEAFAPYITPAAVLAALRQDAAALDNPMIRFIGRVSPNMGVAALRSTWLEADRAPIAPPEQRAAVEFAYQDFGAPGAVVSDTRNERFGLREVRFANGVMLTIKQTQLERDRVRFRLSLDGGSLIETREDPLKTAMIPTLPVGGLGRHSQDELESLFAGRTVQLTLSNATDAFVMGGTTTPRDLALQLDLLAAAITDPGYRTEGDQRYAKAVANYFANLDSTPTRALANREGAILSDNDPRFSLQPREAYEALGFAKLRTDISDRLEHGAIELALVGDLDEDKAIGLVAETLGALPDREPVFKLRPEARVRGFTISRSRHVVTHSGEDNQAMIRLTWPTRDDSDLMQDAELRMLDAVMQILVQEELRERLGQSYSPFVINDESSEYPGYGTFSISASIDLKDVEPARRAILDAIARLASEPVGDDLLERARRPLMEGFDNRLKSLASWMSVADRAQSEASRLARFDAIPKAVLAVDGERLQQAAKRWLVDQQPVEIIVVPESTPLAASSH